MDSRDTVLIIDDSNINRALLEEILKTNFNVLQAENGQIGLDLLHQPDKHISAVLLDLSMPVMDGQTFLKIVRADPRFSDMPIIILTSSEGKETELNVLKMGANDFLSKGFDPILVKQRLMNYIEFTKVTRQRELFKQDPVTGIYNQTVFYLKTAQMLEDNPDTQYVMGYIDIDRFRIIQEIFGSVSGGKILRSVAQTLVRVLQEKGTYARLNNDHFGICYPENEFQMKDILDQIEKDFKALNLQHDIYVNAGLYEIDSKNDTIDQMLYKAELAKNTIGNSLFTTIAWYDEKIKNTMKKEQEITGEMATALQEHQFVAYLQPVYDVKTEKPVSAEALVRWIHPTKGIVPPNEFIPVFERNGFITNLDFYIWEEVLKLFSHPKGVLVDPNFTISINVSRLDLYRTNFTRDLISLIERYKVPASRIKLEITESAYTDQPQQLVNITNELQKYGFKIMMDDFGSGYSSLNMLENFPVDFLKIDMGFMKHFETSPRTASIVDIVVELAHGLNTKAVAEGVETETQVEFLRGIGCDQIQGYYYSKPLSVENFLKLPGGKFQKQV